MAAKVHAIYQGGSIYGVQFLSVIATLMGIEITHAHLYELESGNALATTNN